MMTIFNAKNLTIGYSSPLISNIDFEINAGDVVGIVGINGAGKSTLLKTICGKLKKLSGDITNLKNISFTSSFQKSLPYMTILDVLQIARYRHTDFFNHIKEDDLKIIDEALSVCSILEIKNKAYDCLSDGTKQKVLNAINIAQGSDLMVFDEPLNFLDVPSRGEFLDQLIEYCRDTNKAAIFTTHEWNLCAKKCPKIWGIDNNSNFIKDVNRQYLLDESRICRC